MKRIVIRDHTPIAPFGEPARELRILNKPLWLLQRDLLARHGKSGADLDSIEELGDLPASEEELLVLKDNLFFNANLIDTFIERARATKRACRIAFLATNKAKGQQGDKTIETHALRLQAGIVREAGVPFIYQAEERKGDVYVADIYYYPPGPRREPIALVVETDPMEMGYYHIPSYMAKQGDLIYQVPHRAFLSIENWVQLVVANTTMGVFAWARDQDELMGSARLKDILHWTPADWKAFPQKISFLANAFWEKINPFEDAWRNHFFASRKLVKVGKNCSIDPSAIIHGPTIIGDDVYIGPGTVIANSLIGNKVNIMQGSQVMLSVVSDRCFLPFNAGLFQTTLMDNTMVAQNSTLQLCVIGKNTFIGANNCFTDFNLRNEPIRTVYRGHLEDVGLPVLGSAVGHNCKLGSGFIIYPGRMINSNAIIVFDHEENLIRKNVPGLSPDDVDETTGEPRHIYYQWPRVVEPAAQDGSPQATLSADVNHTTTPETLIASLNTAPIHAHATRGG